MKKDELLTQCRYYKGEDISPFKDDDLSWFWDMERVYVKNDGIANGEIETYKTLGGLSFQGIPFNLLMIMFTSWAKYTYDLRKELPKFYLLMQTYLSIASDYYPENEIPK